MLDLFDTIPIPLFIFLSDEVPFEGRDAIFVVVVVAVVVALAVALAVVVAVVVDIRKEKKIYLCIWKYGSGHKNRGRSQGADRRRWRKGRKNKLHRISTTSLFSSLV